MGSEGIGTSDIHSYSVREASALTGFTPAQIRGAVKRGDLTAMLPNGYMRGARIRECELRRWYDLMEERCRGNA